MTKEHLQRLEWARSEVLARVGELEEKRRKQEIGGIEHKVLMHERLFGREKDEFLSHIDGQIHETRSHLREQREIRIAAAVMLLVMAFAFASTFIAPDTMTGMAAKEAAAREEIFTECWNSTPPEESHTTPTECKPAKSIEEK